ncbi:MAG: Gfo/Idh/MocA family oxidoreductase, partial [Verrucomicrobia bacterium]|nr:Gfo/Idh/MocA family oxidoreductase [Verrucomicrobiota bacterium]
CLMSQNPHTFDLIQFFGGPVATLQTITRRQIDEDAFYALQAKLGERGEAAYNLREPGLVGIHTSSTLQFESGAVGSFDLSTTAPANRIGGDSFAITSDRGETLVVTRLDNAVHTRADGTESVITAEGWHRKASSFGLEYQHFADVIAGAAPTVVTLEDGLRSVRLYDAYIRSLATVQPVNV